MNQPCVYAHYAADGSCIYVGVSENLEQRMKVHMLVSPWRSEIAVVDHVDYENMMEASFMERDWIRNIRPKYNSRHKWLPSDIELDAMHHVHTPHRLLDFVKDAIGFQSDAELALFFCTTEKNIMMIRLGMMGITNHAEHYFAELMGVYVYQLRSFLKHWRRK